MEVVKNKETVIRFDELGLGDYFKYNDEPYIRIEHTEANFSDVNVVKLTTGETAFFYENTEVVKTNAKIVEG